MNQVERQDFAHYSHQNRLGLLHCTTGPAIEWLNGDKEWWHNGQRHREDGPAVEHADGLTEWWKWGKVHCFDGPAIDFGDGRTQWVLDGKQLDNDQVCAHLTQLINDLMFRIWWMCYEANLALAPGSHGECAKRYRTLTKRCRKCEIDTPDYRQQAHEAHFDAAEDARHGQLKDGV